MELTDKTAIVTGGTRGIGLAIARALLERGANVAFTGTRDESVARAAGELKGAAADRAMGIRADGRRHAEIARAFADAAARFGGIDIVVNNAGVGAFTPVADMALDDWHRVIDTNLTAVFYACREAIGYLRTRGGGWIVNVSSLAGKNPFPNGAAYCASKAALNAFSESLMQEVRYDGIRVAYVLPGSVNTGFGGLANTKAEWALMPEDIAEVVTDLIAHPSRSLPSRVEIRPAQPPRKG